MLLVDDNALNGVGQNVCKTVVAAFVEIPLKPLILAGRGDTLLGQSSRKLFQPCSLGK
jgi:hypothetical protein